MGKKTGLMKALVAAFIDDNHKEAVIMEVCPPAESPADPWGCEFEAAGCRHLDDLGLSFPPSTGIWVWEGSVFYPGPNYEGICDDGPEWQGCWRTAKFRDLAGVIRL